jgi:AraC-like DNA-binding protein
MSGKIKDVPVNAKGFFDPHTRDGVVLEGGRVPVPHVHECGVMVLDGTWNYQGVCSPFWRAYYNRDGGAAVRVHGKLLRLGPGQVVILPEEVRYDCIPRRGVRHFWIHFSVEAGQAAAFDGPWEIRLDRHGRQAWENLCREVSEVSEMKRAHGVRVRLLRHLCAAALVDAIGRVEDARLGGVSPRLRQLLSWFERSLASPPSLDEMAARAGMGRRSFFRWFRNETGSTPVNFLTRLRIREACRLLRFGTDSIEQIAETTGFANRHHFTRVFTAQTGAGPAAYRKGR